MSIAADEPPIVPRKRRGLRFSLRALMIVVGLVAATCGWVRYHVAEQRRHAAKIDALQTYADVCHETYLKTNALRQAIGRGSEDFEYYASEWHCANADLALANGDTSTAIDELKESLRYAQGFVRENQVNFGGPPEWDENQRMQRACGQRMKIELKLAELSPEAIDIVRKEFAEGHFPWNR